MYIALLPIGIETQPLLCLFAVATGAVFIIKKQNARLDLSSVLLILLIIIITGYFVLDVAGGRFPIVDFAKYLIGPACFVAMRQHFYRVSSKLLAFFTYLFLAIAIPTTINFGSVSDSIKSLLAHLMIRNAVNLVDANRGISLIANEPSYAAGQLIFLLLLADYCRREITNSRPKMDRAITRLSLIIIVLIILTRSVLGFVFLLAYFAPIVAMNFRFRHLLWGIGSIVALFVSESLRPTRISQFFEVISQLDMRNLLVSLSFLEPSGTTRLILNIAAFVALFFNPLGYGVSSFQSNWYHILDWIGFNFVAQHEILGAGYLNQDPTPASTYLANVAHDFGLLPVCLILSVVLLPFRFPSRFPVMRIRILLVVSVMLLFQSQITNPIPWALMIMLHNLSDLPATRRNQSCSG